MQAEDGVLNNVFMLALLGQFGSNIHIARNNNDLIGRTIFFLEIDKTLQYGRTNTCE
jgi:hypothetical protein